MQGLNRVTLVLPNREYEVEGGYMFQQHGRPAVKVREDRCPNWEQVGMDIVGAYDDGTVATSFTVAEMSTTASRNRLYTYRVYVG